ncbi:MAG: DUF512 domain-containing protein [Oscillospiraceae bacterium]
MPSVIKSIDLKSPASKTRLSPGDKLLTINGKEIRDVLDYKYFSYDARLLIEAEDKNGKIKRVKIKKDEGEDTGLGFETYLMDRARSCANKCVFCFVDQLPKGMRETLYFKDDDARLSFLMGNYITLTNLSAREVQRIIDLRVSPINISVHATDPELRSMLLGNRRGGEGIEVMRRFAAAGIVMNCQIVCCPGINDGEALSGTMRDLAEMYPGVGSVSIVPVGLTKYREGLCRIKPYDKALALETVRMVEKFSQICLERRGSRIFFCADELYIKAGLPIPDDDFYEDYPQLENGVGMLRLIMTEFNAAVFDMPQVYPSAFSIATGVSAAPFMEKLLYTAREKCANIKGQVYAIQNDFFGHTIDVAGLVTGGDLIAQLKGKDLGARLLIPQTMLRHGEGVFLDDVTTEDVERELSVSVCPVAQEGFALCEAMFDIH